MIFPLDSHNLVLYPQPAELAEKEIFVSPSGSLPGIVEIKSRFDRPAISQIFGFLIFTFSIIGLYIFAGPVIGKEISFRLSQLKKETVRIAKNEPVKEKKITFSDLLGKVNFESGPAPVNAEFGIVIPKIGVNAKVIANVDADKVSEFTKALKLGVAHAAGTSLPNQEGTTFIFGHSTDYPWNINRYNAIFYQLKDLEIGDEINIYYLGQRYFYKVVEKKIIDPKETDFLKESGGAKQLVLQTCWPPGTTKERLLVFAQPVGL